MCRMRIRVPEQWWGDYLATLGAARIGERELLALGARGRLGPARRLCRGLVRLQRAADGRGDPPPAQGPGHAHQHARSRFPAPPDGIPIKVDGRASIPRQAMIEVDLARQSRLPALRPQPHRGAARGQRAMVGDLQRPDRPYACRPTRAASAACEIQLRENCCVGIPRPPDFSCSVATTNLADRVANPVQCAIAELADGFGHGRDRPDHPARRSASISGATRATTARPSSTRSISAAPAAPARPVTRRLADHHPCRQCRHVPPGQRRGRRAAPPDLRRRRRHLAATRRAPDASAARPAPMSSSARSPALHEGALHRRRHGQPGAGRPRRAARRPVGSLKRDATARSPGCRPAAGSSWRPARRWSRSRRAAAATARRWSATRRGSSTTSTKAGSARRGRGRSMGWCWGPTDRSIWRRPRSSVPSCRSGRRSC